MGLLDDILGPIREFASVKDEVMQDVTEVKDTLAEAEDQIVQPIDASVDTGEPSGRQEEPQARP